jgi:hypothetical protein
MVPIPSRDIRSDDAADYGKAASNVEIASPINDSRVNPSIGAWKTTHARPICIAERLPSSPHQSKKLNASKQSAPPISARMSILWPHDVESGLS